MKQYVARLENTGRYFEFNNKVTFSSFKELEQLLLSSNITGAKIYSREVSDWSLEGEFIK